MDMKGMESKSDGIKGGVVTVLNTMRQIRNQDATDKGQAHSAGITAVDNTSVPFLLPKEEEDALVAKLRTVASQGKDPNPFVAHADPFFLVACLRVRKGNVNRAHALACNYLRWRVDVRYHEQTAHELSPSILDALSRGLFTVAGNASRDGGRPVLTVRYKFFDPRRYSPFDTARAFGFVIEYMLRTYPRSQTHGIVVVDDATDFSLANFDVRLIHFLEKAFTQVLPVRIAALFVTNPSWIIKTMFTFFSGFLSKKLKTRIRLVDRGDTETFAQFFEPSNIPTFLNLGGTLEWTQTQQDELVDRITQSCTTWPPASSHPGAQ